ncbi:MAG: hypothetical protein QM775_33120 [Pirellulales bacterium]
MIRQRMGYRSIQENIAAMDKAAGNKPLQASVVLLAACQDSQVAREEGLNGLFTRAIKKTLSGSNPKTPFSGNFERFHGELRIAIGAPAQTPNLYRLGTANNAFLSSDPPLVV